MSGPGGRKAVRCLAAFLAGLSLAGGLAACAYEDDTDPPPPAATGPSQRPVRTIPARDPKVLAVEARNYAQLDQRLAAAPEPVLLADAGPADGPGVGFGKTATVLNAGPHTLTAACVGISRAQINLTQNTAGGSRHIVLELDCSGTRTQVVQLQDGYIAAHLLARRDPSGAWTGAVAGLRITAGGPAG